MPSNFEQIKKIYNAFKPFQPLEPGDPAYVDFQAVRGDSNIETELGRKIVFAEVSDDDEDNSTCQLYSGHRGAGKSTELLRLKKYLEKRKCFVVYFSVEREDIDIEDVQYTDILLTCTRHLLKNLKDANAEPILDWLKDRWKDLQDLSLTTGKLENLGIEVGVSTFAKITANLRTEPSQRAKIRQLVNPHTTTLLQALNQFIKDAQNKLPSGKNKLVLIADSLDRIAPTIQDNGTTNHDQIFIDRAGQLKGLDCHIVYTVPISLLYSDRANNLEANYDGNTQILPMVKVKDRNGNIYENGLNKLQEVIAKRIEKVAPNLNIVPKVFENQDIIKELCLMSGGHVRELIQLVRGALNEIDSLPVTEKAAKRSIAKLRDVYNRTVNEDEWKILAEVAISKELKNQDEYRKLLFNRCLLEYVDFYSDDNLKRWCNIHPLIKDISKFQKALQKLENGSGESNSS